MIVLVVGGGGREHALAWKLAQSPLVSKIFCAPGNAGTAVESKCENLAIKAEDVDKLVVWANNNRPDLTVIGPEVPLYLDIVSRWPWDLAIFGPNKLAAQIETDKVLAKKMMNGLNIPTAAWQFFDNAEQAKDFVRAHSEEQWVVKIPELCAGKGVKVGSNTQDTIEAIDGLSAMSKNLGHSGRLIIEKRLVGGVEFSLLAVCDGRNYLTLLPAKDYKPVGDDDTGENTGGMGAYCPATHLTPRLIADIAERGIKPIVNALEYRGCLYLGGMLLPDGRWYVLEYNCRFGDPETQVILPLLVNDLAELLLGACHGSLPTKLEWHNCHCICVVMCSGGYPGPYEKGKDIHGLSEAKGVAPDLVIFHAGTADDEGMTVTAGGRVVNVVALGGNLLTARIAAKLALEKITFDGEFHRSDIAANRPS